jgi:signal transduction histidine kinase
MEQFGWNGLTKTAKWCSMWGQGAPMTAKRVFSSRTVKNPLNRRAFGTFSVRPIGLAMLTVVASFATALYLSQSRGEGIGVRSGDIGANALPSIEHLLSATVALRQLGMDAHRYVSDSSRDRPRSKAYLEASRRRLAEDLAAYRALPTFAGEREQSERMVAALAPLDEVLRKALDHTEAREFELARQTVRRPFRETVEEVEGSIHRLILMNIANASEAAAGITQLQRRAEVIALMMGGLSLLAAGIATFFAYRAIRAQSQLALENQQILESQAAELEAFAGRVAHELKQPLAVLALRMHTWQRDPDPKSLDRMVEQVKRMGRTIDGLLEFARSGAKPPSGQQTNLVEIIERVVADVKASADDAGAELRIEKCAPVLVACSPEALVSALSNLVQNAVKFIVEGSGPTREITLRAVERGEMVRVSVEDTGPGLPRGAERRIFEPYVRLPETSQPGFGLGLAMVRRIAEAYGGKAGVESVTGAGSLFWFELPKAAPASAEGATRLAS